MPEAQFYVEIVEKWDGLVIKRMGPMSPRKADSVRRGAEINLNHERYRVRIKSEEPTA
jgi:hypothetical protein